MSITAQLLSAVTLAVCLAGTWADAVSPDQVPDGVVQMIRKSESMGIKGFPITFWNYTDLGQCADRYTEEEVASWKDAGFTLVQGPVYSPLKQDQVAKMRQILDWAQARGIKVALRPNIVAATVDALEAGYREEFTRAVKQLGDHPAVFGFMVGDEPTADTRPVVFGMSRVQKQVAPHLFPWTNLLPWWPPTATEDCSKIVGSNSWPEYLDEFVKEAKPDFISYDFYHQMKPGTGGWDSYFENLRLYREAALRNGLPFWNTVLSVGHFRYRCPNLDEIRWQFNTSVAGGAHGVAWFHYYVTEQELNYRMGPVDEFWEKTQTWKDIRRVQRRFSSLYGGLFSRLACTKVMFSPKPYGKGELFKPDGIVCGVVTDPVDHPVIISEFSDIRGHRYVMIINNSMTESAKVRITFTGKETTIGGFKDGKPVGWAIGGDRLEPQDGGIGVSHWLAPGQEAVWWVNSKPLAAEPITNPGK